VGRRGLEAPLRNESKHQDLKGYSRNAGDIQGSKSCFSTGVIFRDLQSYFRKRAGMVINKDLAQRQSGHTWIWRASSEIVCYSGYCLYIYTCVYPQGSEELLQKRSRHYPTLKGHSNQDLKDFSRKGIGVAGSKELQYFQQVSLDSGIYQVPPQLKRHKDLEELLQKLTGTRKGGVRLPGF
jgi:hypothetical protein